MIASTTQLNVLGAELPELPGVHAVTDVTGFGLLGHTLEMCRGASLQATLHADAVPVLPEVATLAEAGFGTGAATRNWASYGDEVTLPPDWAEWRRGLLCDPQTSGGLLIAVAHDTADEVLALARHLGFDRAAAVGRLDAGAPRVVIER